MVSYLETINGSIDIGRVNDFLQVPFIMSIRSSQLRLFSSLVPVARASTPLLSTTVQTQCQFRSLHQHISPSRIPAPTPFVPDTLTFLTLIGRNLSQHASKIPTWEALFSLTSTQLRELGVEPPRSRRYLLRWREKYRKGEFGIGGEAKQVVDGVAEVRVAEVPVAGSEEGGSLILGTATATRSPGMKKVVINVPVGAELAKVDATKATKIKGLKVKGANTITGPWVQPVSSGVAHIKVQEGLWEQRRGHKIDGGERRQAEVRAKKRGEERKTAR